MGHGSYNPLGKGSASGAGRTKDDLWSMHIITRSTRGGSKIHHPLFRPFSPLIMPSPPSSIEASITFWSEQDSTKREHTSSKIGLGDTLGLERRGDRLICRIYGVNNSLYKSRLKIPPDCGVEIEVTNISHDSGNTETIGKTTITLQEGESVFFEQRVTGLDRVHEKAHTLEREQVTESREGEGSGEGGEKHEDHSALAEKLLHEVTAFIVLERGEMTDQAATPFHD